MHQLATKLALPVLALALIPAAAARAQYTFTPIDTRQDNSSFSLPAINNAGTVAYARYNPSPAGPEFSSNGVYVAYPAGSIRTVRTPPAIVFSWPPMTSRGVRSMASCRYDRAL